MFEVAKCDWVLSLSFHFSHLPTSPASLWRKLLRELFFLRTNTHLDSQQAEDEYWSSFAPCINMGLTVTEQERKNPQPHPSCFSPFIQTETVKGKKLSVL